jgi:hypothetical protein
MENMVKIRGYVGKDGQTSHCEISASSLPIALHDLPQGQTISTPEEDHDKTIEELADPEYPP